MHSSDRENNNQNQELHPRDILPLYEQQYQQQAPYNHSSSSSSATSNYLRSSPAADDDEGMKLFIGQIPKHLDEDALRPFFDEFGPIVELTVIRDKNTRVHRGCAFLTYALRQSALRAIQALHDKVKLPNSLNPLQIRPAESHSERENKIFVGMLPKSVSEGELHDMFSPYGLLKEIHIIRGPEGHSKGCAFVKFIDRDAANAAIDELNDTIPEGSSRPLVIKFADSKKMREGEELLMTSGNIEQYWGPKQELEDPSFGPQGPYAPQPLDQYSYYEEDASLRKHSLSSSNLNRLSVPQAPTPPLPQPRPQSVPPPTASHGGGRDKSSNNSRPAEGPTGANLFIYHLPRDLTDADLATLFAPFGPVISAKVFVDKKTDESKGFGFVSYSSVNAAEAAIEAMNGFQIGSKRLKVQHKRVGADSKTMGMPPAMSNYGPTGFYPNNPPQSVGGYPPPQSVGGYPPQYPSQSGGFPPQYPSQSGGFPPQYHQRGPSDQDLDIYSPHYQDLDGPYDVYLRERDGRYGDYQYAPPPAETERYHARVPSQYPEEIRYSQQQLPPRENLYMYGLPSSGRQQQTHSNSGYLPEYYDDSELETQFDQSMRFYRGEM